MFKLKIYLLNAFLTCFFASALMACGTKGPLYIPEQRYPQEANVPASDANKIDAEKAVPNAPTQTQPTK